MSRRVQRLALAAAVACLATGSVLAGSAGASTRSAAEQAVRLSPSAAASTCHWKVTWPVAGVYEEPTNASTLLKDKHAGDVVGDYCWSVYNSTEGHYYEAVVTDSAADGIGWIRLDALQAV